MSVRNRLRSLEEATGIVAGKQGCAACNGKQVVIVEDLDMPHAPPKEPTHCPECGRDVRLVIQIVREGDGEA